MQYKDFLGLETTPERPRFPIIIEAIYEISDGSQSAVLQLRGFSARDVALTIIHENVEIAKHEMAGNEVCERLRIADGEALVILARRNGDVVACGLYQANLDCRESIGSVFIPVTTSNMEIVQSDAQMTARALARALDSLADLEDTQKVEVAR